MTTNDLYPTIAARIGDPGAYVARKLTPSGEPMESVPRWAARAVVEAIQPEMDKLRAELDDLRMQVYAQKPVIEAAQAWAELHEESDVRLIRRRSAAPAVANLYDAVEQYRVMDLALTTAREQKPGVSA